LTHLWLEYQCSILETVARKEWFMERYTLHTASVKDGYEKHPRVDNGTGQKCLILYINLIIISNKRECLISSTV
jgi:hypothetical protein